MLDVKNILSKCDHTLLGQTATWEQIKKICDDGMKYETASVCIPPSYVKQAKEYVGDKLQICTVIGFPNGYNTTEVKVFETQDAIANTIATSTSKQARSEICLFMIKSLLFCFYFLIAKTTSMPSKS